MGRTAWGEGAEVACGTRETRRLGEEDERQRSRPCKNLSTQGRASELWYAEAPERKIDDELASVTRTTVPSLSFDSVRYAANDCFAHHLYDRYYRGYLACHAVTSFAQAPSAWTPRVQFPAISASRFLNRLRCSAIH